MLSVNPNRGINKDISQGCHDIREIINMLASKSLHLNAVAENFDVSRPAISKHIKILQECGLIVIKQEGRHRHCEVKLEKLNEVSDWVEQYRKFWEARLDSLEDYLNKLQAKEKKHGGAKKKRKRIG